MPRGTRSAAAIGVFAAALSLTAVSPAAQTGSPIVGPGGKQIGVLVNGRVRSDGELTVGAPESLRIAHMPRRAHLFVNVSPAPGTNECFVSEFICSNADLSYLPGGSRKTSGKGRAVASIALGRDYARKRFSDNKGAEHFQLQDGDKVLIEVFAQRRRHKQLILGIATGQATVRVTTTPTP